MHSRRITIHLLAEALLAVLLFSFAGRAHGQTSALPSPATFSSSSPSTKSAASAADPASNGSNLTLQLGIPDGEPKKVAIGLQILALLTVLTIAPAILIMVTSFTRIAVVLGFVRRALATQEVPPTQVLLGLALFLTFFVMAPTWNAVYNDALKPYFDEQISIQEAYKKAEAPVRQFLFKNTRVNDLALFVRMSGIAQPETRDDVPTFVVVPAFLISELQTAFLIGFIIYIPFLIIDMVISSILLSMGMMMLPPVVVSLPFKIILFVLVDGWGLVIGSLVRSFGA